MSYKTILVHITSDSRCFERFDMAIKLAQGFDASLLAVHAFFPYIPPGYVLAQMGQGVVASQKQAAVEIMRKTEESLRDHLAVRSFGQDVEWHKEIIDPLSVLREHTKYADIAVVGQSDSELTSAENPDDLPERLVLSGGRPILIVPKVDTFQTVGKNILVAWNGSREAVRAVTDALPLLKRADKVVLLSAGPDNAGVTGDPSVQIVKYLDRHEVNLNVERVMGVIDIGNEILSRAAEMGSDLIVMGGYGHSRLRELVLGGVTRTILETMTVPVLMAH